MPTPLQFELAARELARTPEAQYDKRLEFGILWKYGIFLDCITDDELSELNRMIQEFSSI